ATEVANLQLQLDHAATTNADVVAPELLAPPQSAEEAVNRARSEFGDSLVFGSDVDAGAKALAPDAGPPEKIYRFLSMLADLTTEMRKGPLGESPSRWLSNRGGTTSDEREGTRNNKSEMAKRTWDAS